ncbi:MAG: protein-glutamate O-methyltransferase [Paracoccaceae bacterium]
MIGPTGSSAEYPFTDRDFRIIADIAYRESGISLPEGKLQLVYSRLVKRVRSLRLSSFHEYCDIVRNNDAVEERQHLISALTTNVTRFRREAHHNEHLRNNVLPEVIDRALRGDRVRFWSAACATGQEAYEIAFELLATCPNAADLDVRILATDIDPVSLATAQAGTYGSAALTGLPDSTVRQFFRPLADATDRVTVTEAARRLIAFRNLNLVRPWPVKGPFDAVFCRNVAIYFDVGTQEQLWCRFAEVIAPGGALYIGHSERLSGAAAGSFSADGVTTFRRRPAGTETILPTMVGTKGTI